MATVKKYRGRWVADYRDQHRKRRIEIPHGPFDNLAQEKTAAQELLAIRLAEVARGNCVAARARLTFSEVCDRYLESKVNIRSSTMRSYAGLIACYLRPYFGGSWKIHTITASDIERYRAELARGLPSAIADALAKRRSIAKPKWSQARAKQSVARLKTGTRTINKSLTLLTMIFNYAARHRWVDHNPAEYVEKLKNEASRHDGPVDGNILTPEEVRLLIGATDDHYRLLVQSAVFTGMRQGELLGLQWGDIDWSSRQIHVRRAWKDGAFTQPKTRNSQRRVDVPDFLLHELKKWRLRCPKGELDMVFPNGAGNPETHANVLQRGFYPALRRAGLRKIRFHDLRHTFASLLIANGEDVVRVSRLLGHASPNITLSTYSHMLPKEHYGSTDRLAQLVYGTTTECESALSFLRVQRSTDPRSHN
jgi:integrase